MDTSKEYVAMCRCQELAERHLEGGDFYSRNGSINVVKWSSQFDVSAGEYPSTRQVNHKRDKHILTQDDRMAGNRARWQGHDKLQLVCAECGNPFSCPPSVLKKGKGKFCSQTCANRAKGRAMSVTRQFKQNGYVYVKTWDHPFRSKQNLVAEHRLVVEQAIGRYLTPKEAIHHIDTCKTNNSLDNLFLCKNDAEHRQLRTVDAQFLRMFNAARYLHWGAFEGFDITKNRQDQLQEMARGCRCPSCLSCKVDRFLNGTLDHFCEEQMQEAAGNEHSWTGPTSMEQVWLSVVMHENYDKYWTGESWVNAKQEQQLAEAIAEWVATINAATIDQRSA